MKHETDTPEELDALQALLDHSVETASPAVADSVGARKRQMRAAELVEFWTRAPLLAMTTVGPAGQPHSAPVHARLKGVRLHLVIYDNTVRRRDLASNPRVSFVGWGSDGEALILYGRAREVPGSLRPARDSAGGNPRRVVEIEVELTRIYAMRGRVSA